MKLKIAKAFVEKTVTDDGMIEAAVASTGATDRHGEIINQDGWDLKAFKKNSPLLWGHNIREERPPIGKVTRLWFEGDDKKSKLMFKAKFDLTDPFAEMIYRKFQDKYLNAFSVGFMPIEKEGETYIKQELLEISAVPVPANPESLVVNNLEKDGITPVSWKSVFERENKKVVPFSAYPTANESRPWKASAAEARLRAWAGGPDKDTMNWQKYRKVFTWYDSSDEQNFRSYKLPHHDLIDGTIKTLWTGVKAAMGALLGARGGVNIPEGEKKGVYNHLVRHYEQFDKEAPNFKFIEGQALKILEPEIAATYFQKSVNEVSGQVKALRNEVKQLFKKKKETVVIDKFTSENFVKALQYLTERKEVK